MKLRRNVEIRLIGNFFRLSVLRPILLFSLFLILRDLSASLHLCSDFFGLRSPVSSRAEGEVDRKSIGGPGKNELSFVAILLQINGHLLNVILSCL
jgi:hypothetical protein